MKWEKHDLATHKEKDKNNPYEGHSLMIKKRKKSCCGTLLCTAEKKVIKNRKRCPGKEKTIIIISVKDECLLNCSAVIDSQQQNKTIMSKHWLKISAF